MASKKKCSSPGSNQFQFMDGVCAYFFEPGIGKKRVEILCRQLEKFGGTVVSQYGDNITHIITSKSLKIEKLFKALKIDNISESVKVLDADWLSACFFACKKCDYSPYEMIKASSAKSDETLVDETIEVAEKIRNNSSFVSTQPTKDESFKYVKKRKCEDNAAGSQNESAYSDSENESEATQVSPLKRGTMASPAKTSGAWLCMKPSTKAGEDLNRNIIEKLEVLAKAYTNKQDRWRALGYQKAIASIKNYPKRIETVEEVKTLPFIGDRLAIKIAEIIETGHLRRLDHLDPNIEIINKFADVWGAGPKTAEKWVAQGFKTLEDIRLKANLTYQQKIGLKFYDEFLEKIDRGEVEEIHKHVEATACELVPGMLVVTCGSYRRGRQTCGDVDILMSHPDGRSHKSFLKRIIDALQKKGLITNDLVTVDNEEQNKYMGVFKLPGESRKHRRLDIIVAPFSEWPCALVHFTGSGRLNRSMRQLAKTKNMSLSEHALREGVIRQGEEKLHEGAIVPVFNEEDIFRHIGLDYLQPTERDW
ncbi:DNA polymerase lambda-like isoform X1 [Rhopilema esculentum]|uniref:DNA polymerase lambda-like isoform X1 n=1 Tax=Rhopilema esculentum TaxID=499914 RepID=UPI0031D221E0